MRLTQLLAIVGSLRFQMRLARTEAMLSEQNKLLQDGKLARQAQQPSKDHDSERNEQTMKHKHKVLQISSKVEAEIAQPRCYRPLSCNVTRPGAARSEE